MYGRMRDRSREIGRSPSGARRGIGRAIVPGGCRRSRTPGHSSGARPLCSVIAADRVRRSADQKTATGYARRLPAGSARRTAQVTTAFNIEAKATCCNSSRSPPALTCVLRSFPNCSWRHGPSSCSMTKQLNSTSLSQLWMPRSTPHLRSSIPYGPKSR